MGLVVSSLTDYLNEQSQTLLTALHYEGTTAKYMQPLAGVKTKEALQIFALTAYPQDNAQGCDMVASGSAAFTQRVMEVEKIGYRDELCMDNLLPKWTQMLLAPGSMTEDEITQALAGEFNSELKMLITEHQEVADWQGNTASGDAILRQYDGLIKIIDAAGTAVTGNTGGVTTGTGITTSNVIAIVTAMWRARPEKLKRKTGQTLWMGTDIFDMWVQALGTANLFHVDATMDLSNYELRIPGTNVHAVGVSGLTGTNRMFLGMGKRNFWYGFDLLSDTDKIEWKILENDKMRYTVKLKRGLQVAFPEEIVQFKLA